MQVEDLASAVTASLKEYTDEINEGVKKVTSDTAKEANEEIKKHCTFQGSGKYIKAFALKDTSKSRYNHQKTWYVKKPYYRLTHLLERGHVTKNGGRTRAFPHIQYGEEFAQANLESRIQGAIERASQ